MVPLRDGEDEIAGSWKIGHKIILELALEKLAAPESGIGGIFIAGKALDRLRENIRAPGVSFLETDVPWPGTEKDEGPLDGVRALIRSVEGPLCELHTSRVHILVLDPFRPLVGRAQISAAVQGFHMLEHEERGRLGVTAVSRVRNHHHPKKVLCLSEDGGLAHFNREGAGIYQRQQLAGDDYYVIDPALAVIGSCGASTDWDPRGWAAVPLDDNRIRVEDEGSLRLARDLHPDARLVECGGVDCEQH